ncbi:PIN domain-containing protein [bacterium]|nr:MAG: PIN domain-containing protein [bacterium]
MDPLPRRVLIDTGVLIRYLIKTDPQHGIVARCIEDLFLQGDLLCYAPQSIREAWSVLTRPNTSNGYGFDQKMAEGFVRMVRAAFLLVEDVPDIFSEWERLVRVYSVHGKNVHDANLVASAVAHGVTHILTLNERDFRRFSEITLIPVL